MSAGWNETHKWIDVHRKLYLEDGEKGHLWDSTAGGGPGLIPTLLLYTTGRKSGNTFIMPLIYGEGEGGYVLIASKGGAPAHPDWYLNLQANPEVKLKVINDEFAGVAETVEDERREGLWKMMVEIYPPFQDYQEKTERQIPLVLITRKA